MPGVVVLLPSPLLGPAVWQPVSEALRVQGWTAQVPRLAVAPTTPQDVVRQLLDVLPEDRELVLVPHSGAGLYVAALAAERDVRAVVFVDAGVPTQGGTPAAPPSLLPMLTELADEQGLLPPWTAWWPPGEISPLFPDDDARASVEAEQVRLPLSYLCSVVPAPPGWEQLPVAYLAFGNTYVAEYDRATAAGWAAERLAGRHLNMLVEPEAVAAAIVRLLEALGVQR